MTKIKLCGMMREEDIKIANSLLPEYVGFIFASKSRRYISIKEAQNLKELLHKKISAVGVFVNENPKVIAELLNKNIIDIAQLHGSEDELYIKKLKESSYKPMIKVFNITEPKSLEQAENCKADYIMFDSGCGGTGESFNWSILKNFKRKFFLAGGLSDRNVISAIKMCHPYAVDVSSGIETEGFKDKNKMEKFVHTVRNTDY